MKYCLRHHVNPFPVIWTSNVDLQQEQQIIIFRQVPPKSKNKYSVAQRHDKSASYILK